MLVRDKHSSLLDPFISYIKNILNTTPGALFTTLQFLRNLKINPIYYILSLDLAKNACQEQTI
jgi:hypothetical protein